MSGGDDAGTYRDLCPKCGARLVGFTKEEYVQHLRDNGEMLAAEIEEKMVVPEPTDCADANTDCADAKQLDGEKEMVSAEGAQRDYCPECDRRSVHYVKAKTGDSGGAVAKKLCTHCEHERVEYTLPRVVADGE